jgi:membrane fusion protein (multidrug efflux system)
MLALAPVTGFAKSSPLRLVATLALLAALGFTLAVCSDYGGEEAAAQQQEAPPPPAVAVVTLEAERIPVVNELPGRIAPTRIAGVLPRVSGIIEERVFTQGSLVEAGDVLYRIDPEPFRVRLESAEASLRRAESVALQARQEAERQEELRERAVSSVQRFDTAVAELAQAEADVSIAEANVAEARLNLDYAEVKAPISGRIGRANITEGALVSESSGETLATIQQLDPVYADFTQSAGDLLRLREALDAGSLTSDDAQEVGDAVVYLEYDDGSAYEEDGRLLFQETNVDTTTGQVTLRAEFPNPQGDLLPGLYVRVLIEQGVDDNAVSIPQQAVSRDPDGGAQVYVLDDENVAELRPIRLGRVVDETRWLVENGLEAGDRIVVEGLQKVRPDAPVTPEDWNPDTDAAAGTEDDAAADADDASAEGEMADDQAVDTDDAPAAAAQNAAE